MLCLLLVFGRAPGKDILAGALIDILFVVTECCLTKKPMLMFPFPRNIPDYAKYHEIQSICIIPVTVPSCNIPSNGH